MTLSVLEVPLLEDLEAAGVLVDDVYDLLTTDVSDYRPALPVLVRHLHRDYPDPILDGIARALVTPEAHFAWSALLTLFRQFDEDERYRPHMAVALALSVMATKDDLDDVMTILEDPGYGRGRVCFLSTLTRLRLADRWDRIEQLADDPWLHTEATRMLRMRESRERAKHS